MSRSTIYNIPTVLDGWEDRKVRDSLSSIALQPQNTAVGGVISLAKLSDQLFKK